MFVRVLLLIALALPLPALAQLRWVEGRHFTTLPGGVPAEARTGKIEVAEVFSYGCIHCFRSKEEIAKLQAALPADAYMSFVHAAFQPAEAWPMYQRAWYTAQAMGIGLANHERMFDAVWTTGEVALIDPKTGLVRRPLPTIEEAARFYARAAGVKAADFLKIANSAEINAQMKHADALIQAWRIPGTPSLVVNGRYLVINNSVSNWNDIRTIVLFLVGTERQRLARLQAQPAKPPVAVPATPPARKP
jgi:protein dithiol oxidoreductase (disulfide-forming)